MSSGGQIVGGIIGAVIGWYTGGPAGAFRGAAIGAGIGGYIDPPPGPNLRGPTLDDKTFQSSSYGVSLSRIYGTIATMGNVIYLENNEYKSIVKKEEQGGKGGASQTVETTRYYATFAIALGETIPFSLVRRVWAGGKIIYNSGVNDFGTIIQSELNSGAYRKFFGLPDLINPGWRYYDGTQTVPDSRMEAVLGVGNCPSYEGTAYIVFYDFDLTDYGNGLAGCPIKVELTDNQDTTISDDVVLYERKMPDNIDQVHVSFNCPCNGSLNANAEARGIQFAPPYNKGASMFISAIDGVSSISVTPEGDSDFSYHTIRGVSAYASWYGYVKNADNPEDRRHYVTNGIDTVKSENVTGSDEIRIEYVYDFSNVRFYIGQNGTESYFYIGDELIDTMSSGPITDLVAIGSPNFCYIDKTVGSGDNTRIRVFTTDGALVKTFYIDFDVSINSRCGGILLGSILYIAFLYIGPPAGTTIGAKIIRINIEDEEIIYEDNVEWEQSGSESVSPHCSFFYSMGIFYIAYITGGDLTLCRLVKFFYYSDSPLDTGGIRLSEIVSTELVRGGLNDSDFDVSNLTDNVMGYRISEIGSARGAISPLQAAYLFDLIEDGYLIKSKKRGQEPSELINYNNFIMSENSVVSVDRESAIRMPSRYSISYIDFEREYDANTQHADYPSNEINERSEQVAVVMSPDHAARIADILINLSWIENGTYKASLPQNYLHLRPGDVKSIEIVSGIYSPMRIKDVSIGVDQKVEIVFVNTQPSIYQSGATGSSSMPPNQVIPFIGRSVGILMDIPVVQNFMDSLGFAAAIYGQGSGWPGGVLCRSADDGQTYTQLQGFNSAGTMGSANNVLLADSGSYIDRVSELTIQVLSGNFYSVTETQMMTGVNYCAYGMDGRWEILQYADAQLLGNGFYSISIFARGLRGTEWATGLHQPGDFFVLLDDPDNAFIGMDLARLNTPMLYKSVTIGQSVADAASSTFAYKAVNLRPLSVVSVVAGVVAGDVFVSWQPRTRLSGAQWSSGVPAPIGETDKKYEVDVLDADENVIATYTVTAVDEWVYTSAQIVEDFGIVPSVINFKIYQISATVGRGYPAASSVAIPLWDPSALTVPAKIWLDETTAVTVATGAAQWDDRSGNGYHFTQINSASQPAVISGAINGRRAIRFDGADDVMFSDSDGARDIMRNVSGGWVFMCFRRVAIDVSFVHRISFGTYHTGAVADRFTVVGGEFSTPNRISFRAKRSDSDSLSILSDGTGSVSYQMLLCNLDYPSTTGEIFVNGESVAQSSAFTTAGSLSSDSRAPYPVSLGAIASGSGANPSALAFDNIEVAALLHGSEALSADDIDRMFGWAAHNYDLTDLLPVGHPYKTNPPV